MRNVCKNTKKKKKKWNWLWLECIVGTLAMLHQCTRMCMKRVFVCVTRENFVHYSVQNKVQIIYRVVLDCYVKKKYELMFSIPLVFCSSLFHLARFPNKKPNNTNDSMLNTWQVTILLFVSILLHFNLRLIVFIFFLHVYDAVGIIHCDLCLWWVCFCDFHRVKGKERTNKKQ